MIREAPLRAMTTLLVVVHLACALLDYDDRAGWTLRPYPSVVAVIADHPAWTVLNAGLAVALSIGLATHRLITETLVCSAAVLTVWGCFLFAWGTELSSPPVSLLGPVLAVAFGVSAFITAHAWISREG